MTPLVLEKLPTPTVTVTWWAPHVASFLLGDDGDVGDDDDDGDDHGDDD